MLLIYGITASLGGSNDFLTVYLAGMVTGNKGFIRKRSFLQFHDGLAYADCYVPGTGTPGISLAPNTSSGCKPSDLDILGDLCQAPQRICSVPSLRDA
jgi:hypothetical protein